MSIVLISSSTFSRVRVYDCASHKRTWFSPIVTAGLSIGQEIAVIRALGLRYASLSPKLATCIGARPLLLPMVRAEVFTNVSKTFEPRIPGIFFFLSLTGVDIGSFTTRKLRHLSVGQHIQHKFDIANVRYL